MEKLAIVIVCAIATALFFSATLFILSLMWPVFTSLAYGAFWLGILVGAYNGLVHKADAI